MVKLSFQNPSLRKVRLQPLHLVLYGSMITLLGFALCFYRLRIFSDTAGYLTDIIRNDGFYVAHYRFVSILNQWLPVLLLKAHASLWAISLAYSFNYSLVPVALALACMHPLKRPYHALAIMLLVVLMNMLLFYYTVSELQTGLCLLLFYDAAADHAKQSGKVKGFVILTLFAAPAIVFSHPMTMPVSVLWLCYRLLKDRTDYQNAGIAALCFAALYAAKKIWFTTSYENDKMLTMARLKSFGLNYYNGPFARSFYSYVLAEAFIVPAVLLCTIVLLILLRKYRLLALLITAVTGIYTIVLIAFEDWFVHLYDHYYEHMLQPAVFFLVLLFCYALSVIPGRPYLKSAGIAIIFVISLAKIHRGRELHAARQKWMYACMDLMDRLHLKKAVAGRHWTPDGIGEGGFWSAGWESLILSSMEGRERSKTLFIVRDTSYIREPIQATDAFVVDGWSFRQSTFPARYFVLGDKPYVILESVVPDSVLEQLRRQ